MTTLSASFQQPLNGISALPRSLHSIQTAAQTTSGFLGTLKELAHAVNGVSLGMIPANLLELASNCRRFVASAVSKKIDAFLDIMNNIKEIGDGIAALSEYLVGLRAVSESALSWAGPFGLAISILSVASIARSAKIAKEQRDLLSEFDAVQVEHSIAGEASSAALRGLVQLIERKQHEDSDFIPEIFNVHQAAFVELLAAREKRINFLLSADDAQKQQEARTLLVKTISSLRGRIQKNIASSAMSIVSSVISIASAILIFCCPLLPAGWILVSVSAAIDTARFLLRKVTDYTFAQEIGLQRTFKEIFLGAG